MSVHVAIIGAYGSAGVAVAERLLEEPDVELSLIDNGEPGGGLCILRGCMPSKDVLSAAEYQFKSHTDERIQGEQVVDLETVIDVKNNHISSFAAHRRKAVERMAKNDNVTFYHETASFQNDSRIEVGESVLEPDYIVIATGSTPSLPNIPGIDTVDVMTSADVLDATSFPDSGIVLGFGFIGLELAPYLSAAGQMEITVIEHDKRPLDHAGAEFGEAIIEYYEDSYGISIRTEATENKLESLADGGVRLHLDENGATSTIEADQLFAFTGRKPAIDQLNLEATSIQVTKDWVTNTMQSSALDHVYIVGDVNGIEPVLHVTKEQGYTAAANILNQESGSSLTSHTPTPHFVVFSGLGILPYVRIGHSEYSAARENINYTVVTRQASQDGVFASTGVEAGLARLIVGSEGTVLGYQGLHYHADVMAKTMQVIIELGLTVDQVPARAYHPTTPEIVDGLIREARTILESRNSPQ